MKTCLPLTSFLAAILLAGCCSPHKPASHVVTQASTYDALYHGLYDGEVPLRQMAPLGNQGLGTVDRFDGEVVLLDGKFHVIRGDGHVDSITDLNITSPFLEVESFRGDLEPATARRHHLRAISAVPVGRPAHRRTLSTRSVWKASFST